ncbi:MAG TPA: zf-HC2 domain-containing protein [Nitrospira sp.]
MKDHPSQWIRSGLTCHDVTDQVSEYLDDSLPVLTKIRIGLHLASCADCRTYVSHIMLVRDTLTCLPRSASFPINRFRLRRHFSARYDQSSVVSLSPPR